MNYPSVLAKPDSGWLLAPNRQNVFNFSISNSDQFSQRRISHAKRGSDCRINDAALIGINPQSQRRIGSNCLNKAQVGELQNIRQGDIAQAVGAGPRHRAGHIGVAGYLRAASGTPSDG